MRIPVHFNVGYVALWQGKVWLNKRSRYDCVLGSTIQTEDRFSDPAMVNTELLTLSSLLVGLEEGSALVIEPSLLANLEYDWPKTIGLVLPMISHVDHDLKVLIHGWRPSAISKIDKI